jgi:hypothetical protein
MINIEQVKEVLKESNIQLMSDGVLYIDIECSSDNLTEELYLFLIGLKNENVKGNQIN